jgi:predicted nucleotidyltransferase
MDQIKEPKIREETDAYNKIITWFFAFPTREMSLNNICYELKISKTTANKVVSNLVEENFLKKEVLGKLWRISANQKHFYFITKKIPYNLDLIYNSNIIEYVHKTIPSTRAIILFGSYRKGDDNEKSDIDIAVEVLSDKNVKIIEAQINKLGYRKNISLNLHIFSRNKIDINLFSNIANGIVLDGFLEARP